MVYSLENGLHSTSRDYWWRGLQLGAVVIGFAVIALFVGNVWYAVRYKPGPQPSGTHPVARSPINLANVTADQGVNPGPMATNMQGGSCRNLQGGGTTTASSANSAPQSSSPVTTAAAGGYGGGPTQLPDPTSGTTSGSGLGSSAGSSGGNDTTDGIATVPIVVSSPVASISL